MGKIIKPGNVVAILSGRYAGRKATVIKNNDEGTSERPYGHAIVGGIDRYPRTITKRMSKKKVKKRIHLKTFYKAYNYKRLMATRYFVDNLLGKIEANFNSLKNPMVKKKTRFEIKRKFEARYKTGGCKWLFAKLQF